MRELSEGAEMIPYKTGFHNPGCPGWYNEIPEGLCSCKFKENRMAPSEDFLKSLKLMEETHRRKSEDYADANNPFSNFDVSEYLISLFSNNRDKVFVWPIATKLARLATLLSNNKSPNYESIADTFMDIAVYTLLWKADVSTNRDSPIQQDLPLTPYGEEQVDLECREAILQRVYGLSYESTSEIIAHLLDTRDSRWPATKPGAQSTRPSTTTYDSLPTCGGCGKKIFPGEEYSESLKTHMRYHLNCKASESPKPSTPSN